MKLRWDSPDRAEKGDGRYVRERSASPYHSRRWHTLSKAFRASHPLCEKCKEKGIIKPATCVDHKVPWPICADFFYDWNNLQALCDECNHLKGQQDKKKIQEWKRMH